MESKPRQTRAHRSQKSGGTRWKRRCDLRGGNLILVYPYPDRRMRFERMGSFGRGEVSDSVQIISRVMFRPYTWRPWIGWKRIFAQPAAATGVPAEQQTLHRQQ